MITLPTNPTDRELRWFGGLGMLFAWGVAAWLIMARDAGSWALAVVVLGLLAAIAGWLRPQLLRWVYLGWMCVVFPIGWVIGHLLLALVYYGVLTPVGWLLRLLGHDPLQRRPDRQVSTYWRARTRQRQARDYFRQF